ALDVDQQQARLLLCTDKMFLAQFGKIAGVRQVRQRIVARHVPDPLVCRDPRRHVLEDEDKTAVGSTADGKVQIGSIRKLNDGLGATAVAKRLERRLDGLEGLS